MPSNITVIAVINVNLLFIFIAGVAFLGFLINALFDRLRITNILPLMLIGLLIGPVLGLVNSQPGSTIANLAPYVSAVAVAFILFEVGLNVNIFRLSKIVRRATKFTFLVAISTGLVLSAAAYVSLHWNILESLIFGFALSGPSSVIVPTLVRLTMDDSTDIKTMLIYEGVITDALQLIVPLFIFGILIGANLTPGYIISAIVAAVFGSIALGAVLALAWLYVLNRFKHYVKMYSWMLTIAMVIATYGISQILGLSGALTIFLFGLMFSNIGGNSGMITVSRKNKQSNALLGRAVYRSISGTIRKYLSLPHLNYIKNYQREIVFFASTFFFVYIGMLFNISSLAPMQVIIAIALTIAIILARIAFLPVISGFLPKDQPQGTIIERLISFDVSRGLSPAIIATVPLSLGIVIPGFLDEIFLVILFTNIASSIGVAVFYRKQHTG